MSEIKTESTRQAYMRKIGPKESNRCPIVNVINITPLVSPTPIMAPVFPVIFNCFSVQLAEAPKKDPIPSPATTLPNQTDQWKCSTVPTRKP